MSDTTDKNDLALPDNEILIYQTEDGQSRLDVRLWNETVWLNQQQLTELFQTTKQNISQHIKNVFEEGELEKASVVKKFFTTATDGKNYSTSYYNLDVIISVGYRVKSHRGTQFRIWATRTLREYIIKGFALDDKRLKEGRTAGNYFDELIERIRDIRSSERNFYRKVQDIYVTSMDYDPKSEMTHTFFATVQNKLHWAVSGKTAAEIIHERADSKKPNMGLTSFSGRLVNKSDVTVAKNYLTKDELEVLNLLVSQYLDFAELQARSKKPMYMIDWINKLHDFLTLNDREILTHTGKISAKLAEEIAFKQLEKFKIQQASNDHSLLHPDLEKLSKTKSFKREQSD